MSDKVKILGVALLLLAFNSSALTLGRLRGAVLVGHPLDVLVQVPLAQGEDAASLCFSAEVFHADVLQDANQVSVVVESAGQDAGLKVRILSSAVVNDPVVSVILHAGCAQKMSRRYVLLSDIPSEVSAPGGGPLVPRANPAGRIAAPPVVVAFVNALPTAPMTLVTPKNEAKSEAGEPPVQAPKRTAKPPLVVKPRPVKPVQQDQPTPQAPVQVTPTPKTLDSFTDRVANLETAVTPAPAEDALLKAQQLQALQSSIKAAMALTVKNDASVLELKNRLQTAQAQHVPDSWLYALVALALAGLSGVAFLLYRPKTAKADSGDWLSASVLHAEASSPQAAPFTASRLMDDNVELDFTLPPEEEPVVAAPKFNLHASAMDEVDVDHIEMSDSKFGTFMPNGMTLAQSPQTPTPAAPKAQPKVHQLDLNLEATQDIRQQAEFFVSLGQTARAVAVLKKKIETGDDFNPHLYLDLLTIYQSQGLKDEFQALRETATTLFNCKVPEFALFKSEGQSLESYPDVLKQIAAVWPKPEALAVIESHILRAAPVAPQSAVDVAAFQDLLLLHSVAQSLAFPAPSQEEDSGPVVSGAAAPVAQDHDLGDLDLNLDLDLSDSFLDDVSPSPVAAQEVDLPLFFPSAQAELHTGNLIEFDASPARARKA